MHLEKLQEGGKIITSQDKYTKVAGVSFIIPQTKVFPGIIHRDEKFNTFPHTFYVLLGGLILE